MPIRHGRDDNGLSTHELYFEGDHDRDFERVMLRRDPDNPDRRYIVAKPAGDNGDEIRVRLDLQDLGYRGAIVQGLDGERIDRAALHDILQDFLIELGFVALPKESFEEQSDADESG